MLHRHKPADRRYPVESNHHGRYVDVDVLLRHAGGESLAGRELPVDGGFDDEGNLTREPGVIEKNRRILPMGYWKGSGLSIVLDMIATLLSDGASVAEVTQTTATNTAYRRSLSPSKWIA